MPRHYLPMLEALIAASMEQKAYVEVKCFAISDHVCVDLLDSVNTLPSWQQATTKAIDSSDAFSEVDQLLSQCDLNMPVFVHVLVQGRAGHQGRLLIVLICRL